MEKLKGVLKDKKFIKSLSIDNNSVKHLYEPEHLDIAFNDIQLLRLSYERSCCKKFNNKHREIVDLEFYKSKFPKSNPEDLKAFFIVSGVREPDTFIKHDLYKVPIQTSKSDKAYVQEIFNDCLNKNDQIQFGRFGDYYCALKDNAPIGLSFMAMHLLELFYTKIEETDNIKKFSECIFTTVCQSLKKKDESLQEKYFSISKYGTLEGQNNISRKSLVQYFMIFVDKDNNLHRSNEKIKASELSDIYKFDYLSRDEQDELFNFFNITDDRGQLELPENLCNKARAIGEDKLEKAISLLERINNKNLTEKDEQKLIENLEKIIERFEDNEKNEKTIRTNPQVKTDKQSELKAQPRKSEVYSEVSVSTSNYAKLTKEDRKNFNIVNVRPKAFEFLKNNGYSFNESEVYRSTIRASKDGIDYYFNFKSHNDSNRPLHFAAFEIKYFKEHKSSYRLLLLTNKNTLQGPYTIEELFKSNEHISITCSTRDYND